MNEVEVLVSGGTVLSGKIKGGDEDGEMVFIKDTLVGDVSIPITLMKGLFFREKTGKWKTRELFSLVPEGKEMLLVPARLGFDTVQGLIFRFTSDSVFFAPEGEDEPSRFPFDSIAAVLRSTREGSGGEPGKEKNIIVTDSVLFLSDGSRIHCRITGMEGNKISLLLPWGQEAKVAFSNIADIDIKGRDHVFLSELEPAEAEEISWFGKQEKPLYPWKRDGSCLGGPLEAKGMMWSRGIGCHSKSILKYKLHGRWNGFLAYAAIDDSAGKLPVSGDVDLKVIVDGKVVWSRKSLKWGDPLEKVGPLDITGAKELVLVVDFGGKLHLGDRLDWLLPVLFR